MSQLHVCGSCSRHVRVEERACPFCAAALSLSPRSIPPRRAVAGSHRAALMFGASVVVAALTGCGAGTSSADQGNGGTQDTGGEAAEGDTSDSSADQGSDESYGAGDGTEQDDNDADQGTAVALYGAPAALYGAPAP